MKPRWFGWTRCAAPVTTEAGVLACVRTAGAGTCADHTEWRSFVWPLRILWTLKRWWPNEIGRAMDQASPSRHTHAADEMRALMRVLNRKGVDTTTPGSYGRQLHETGDLALARQSAKLSRGQLAEIVRLFAEREQMVAQSRARVYGRDDL